jgi:hypothetical protein
MLQQLLLVAQVQLRTVQTTHLRHTAALADCSSLLERRALVKAALSVSSAEPREFDSSGAGGVGGRNGEPQSMAY